MDWIYSTTDPLWQTFVGCLFIFVIIVVLTRIIGLRSFAKFTAYDFAFTIAIGSIISSILTSSTSIARGGVAITGLLLLTYVISMFQKSYPKFNQLISNQPLLLMDGSKILMDNLKHARIDKSQLIAKLREANVLNFEQVFAVVLETTGEISVLHKSEVSSQEKLNIKLLEDVRSTP